MSYHSSMNEFVEVLTQLFQGSKMFPGCFFFRSEIWNFLGHVIFFGPRVDEKKHFSPLRSDFSENLGIRSNFFFRQRVLLVVFWGLSS